VLQHVWHVTETLLSKAKYAKQELKFAALSPVIVTDSRRTVEQSPMGHIAHPSHFGLYIMIFLLDIHFIPFCSHNILFKIYKHESAIHQKCSI
jgi:hypothetical protein